MKTLTILTISTIFAIAIGLSLLYNGQNQVLEQSQQRIYGVYIDQAAYYGPQQVAESIGLPGYGPANQYNLIIFSFITANGPVDAADLWINPFNHMDPSNNPWGNTVDAVQKAWLNAFHQSGKKVLLSAFGATEDPTSQGLDPTSTCTRIANIALQNNFDGLDIDWEDNEAMEKGLGEQWLIECTTAIRQVLPKGKYLLTHAPQAPYFIGTRHYINGAYVTINKQVGDLIDYYNVQFYDQGDTEYVTYQTLFIHSEGSKFNNTAVGDLITNGVPMNKIIIGKPATPQDATNTGYIDPTTLGQFCQQAQENGIWSSGVFTWQYSHDRDGSTFLNPVLSNYKLAGQNGNHHHGKHHNNHHHNNTQFLKSDSQ